MWDSNPNLLVEQPTLSTAEPSLPPPAEVFFFFLMAILYANECLNNMSPFPNLFFKAQDHLELAVWPRMTLTS